MKKKSFDPFDYTIQHGKITMGTIGTIGIVGSMPHTPQTSNIIRGMDTMKIIPTVHAAGGVFGSLNMLNNINYKKKF